MHTCRCIFSLFWVLFTQTLLDSIKTQSDEGGKHLQGESKNHSPLLTTQLRLIESHSSVSAIPVFLYIYIYIDYFSMSVLICLLFFSFYCWSFQSHGRSGVMKKCCVDLPVSLSDPPCFSHDVRWCIFVLLSLPSCRESVSVHILRPSLSPKRALPLPQCHST